MWPVTLAAEAAAVEQSHVAGPSRRCILCWVLAGAVLPALASVDDTDFLGKARRLRRLLCLLDLSVNVGLSANPKVQRIYCRLLWLWLWLWSWSLCRRQFGTDCHSSSLRKLFFHQKGIAKGDNVLRHIPATFWTHAKVEKDASTHDQSPIFFRGNIVQAPQNAELVEPAGALAAVEALYTFMSGKPNNSTSSIRSTGSSALDRAQQNCTPARYKADPDFRKTYLVIQVSPR